MSAEDTVADVAAASRRPVLANAPAGKLRAFVIESGDRMSSRPQGGSGETAAIAGGGIDGVDPRLALFPYAVTYTPVRVSFESTFEAAGNVLWQLRDLPTFVEVRSATLTRGLPLMRVELVVRVLQRGVALDAATPGMSGAAGPAVAGPTARGLLRLPRRWERCDDHPAQPPHARARRARGSRPLQRLVLRAQAGRASAPRPAAEQPLASQTGAAPRRRRGAGPIVHSRAAGGRSGVGAAWRRDPFLFGTKPAPIARPAVHTPVPARPTVRTILYSGRRRLAIVDGRIVGVGDAVGDYTVADIEKGAVVFTTPSGGRLRVPVHATAPEEVAR